MKTTLSLLATLATSHFLVAQEVSPEISGLRKAAEDFVAAYNAKNPDAISQLFTEDGEMTDLLADDSLIGKEAIKAHYEELFADQDPGEMALDVKSVRLVAPNLAIEDGMVHITPPGDDEAPSSSTYTAVLLKQGDLWKIASTRTLTDTTAPAGQLAGLAKTLNGEWTAITDSGMRLDLAIGWDPSGKFLTGDVLISSSDITAQESQIRISWDAGRKAITSWFFDADGGSSQGVWTATESGWTVRSEGTSAEGETTSSMMKVSTKDGILLWSLLHRTIDGESLPNTTLRLAPAAPAPPTAE